MKTPSQAGRQSDRNRRILETQSSCSGLQRVAWELFKSTKVATNEEIILHRVDVKDDLLYHLYINN